MTVESVRLIAGSGATLGSPSWSFPNRVSASDDSRAFVSVPEESQSGELHVYNFDSPISPESSVVGILVEIEHRTTGIGVKDYTLYLRGTDGTAIGDNFAVADLWTKDVDDIFSYGGETEDFGATLTTALVNHANFGIILVANNTANNQATISVDAVWITIYFERAKCDLVWMIGGGLAGFNPDSVVSVYNAMLAKISDNLANNTYIDAVFLSARWKNIEQEEGSFSWTRLDGVIDAIIAAGKTFRFGLMPGIHCPSWIFSNEDIDLFETFASNPYKPNYGEAVYIPIPWNTTYQTKWHAAVSAVANHFTTKGYIDHCTAIKVCPWAYQSMELHLPKEPNDITAWAALDAKTNLPVVFTATLAHYATAFATQKLVLSTLWNIIKDAGLTDALAEIALENYASRLYLQHNSMHGLEPLEYKDPWVALKTWKTEYPAVTLGSQSLASMVLPVDAATSRQGTMEMTCTNVINCLSEYFEIWWGDGLSADKSEAIATLLAAGAYVGGEEDDDDTGVDEGGEGDEQYTGPEWGYGFPGATKIRFLR